MATRIASIVTIFVLALLVVVAFYAVEAYQQPMEEHPVVFDSAVIDCPAPQAEQHSKPMAPHR